MALVELFDAIKLSNRRTCEELLAHGADPNFINRDGISPMHVAAGIDGQNAYEILLLLLQHGGDPNLRSCDGLTPVHISAMWGREDSLRLLLQCNGNPLLRDEECLSAFDHALACDNCDEMLSIIEDNTDGPLFYDDDNNSQGSVDSYKIHQDGSKYDLFNPFSSTLNYQAQAEEIISDSDDTFYDAFSTLGSVMGDDYSKKKVDKSKTIDETKADATEKFHNKSFTKSTNNNIFVYPGDSSEEIRHYEDNVDGENYYDEFEGTENVKSVGNMTTEQIVINKFADLSFSSLPDTNSNQKYNCSHSVPGRMLAHSQSLIEHVDKSTVKEKKALFSRWSSTVAMPKRSSRPKPNKSDKPPKPRKKRTDSIKILAMSSPSKISLRKAFKKQHDKSKTNIEPTEHSTFMSDVTQISPAHIDESFDWSYSEVFNPDDSNISTHSGFSEFASLMTDDTLSYDWKDISHVEPSDRRNSIVIPKELQSLNNEEIRKRLLDLAERPGPITALTRNLYLTYLAKILLFGKQNKDANKYQDYTMEMRNQFQGNGVPDAEMRELDRALTRCFDTSDKKWREGSQKSSFNYLLIDPRVTCNLIDRHSLSLQDLFKTFAASVFYIGKGKKARSYEHLHDALKYRNGQGTPSKANGKIRMIHDIWNAGYGVVSLHLFHSTIPVEAFTREALMIDALGLERLTNQKRGDYYGSATSWSGRQKCQMGVYLLKKAMKILLVEGERQITEDDLRK